MPKKPKFRRAFSLLIAFLFIFECFPARTFAASAPALTYSIDIEGAKESSGTNVFYASQRGDTVTVRFVMRRTDSQESYSLNTMQNEIEYDMSFFKFVEDSISVEKSGLDAEAQTRVMGQEIVKVSALNGSEFAPEQVMCSFQLKIKSGAESDSGWVRCSEAKAVATDYASATVTERNLEVRLKQSGLTVTAAGYNAAYDGAEHSVTATPNITDGTTVEYSVDNGANWSETAPSRKDAGTTQVKVRARNDPYFDATADAVLNVTLKALTVTANAASKTFGEADPELTYSVDGLIGNDSVSGTPERAAGENAGTYAISQGTLSAGGNYAISFQSANLTIQPKDISAASVSLSAHTLSYTGAEQSVSVNAVTLDGTALTEADYTVSGATSGTNVNSYTLTVTGKGNYTGSASGAWNIVNAGMSAKAENVSVTYDKQPHGIAVTDAPSGSTITYSTDRETYSETNPSFTDAGARVVYYKVTASGYDEFTGSATVTIAKRPVVVSGIAAANKVYDGNTNSTLIYDNATFDGIIDGDGLTVTASGAFDSADAGENKTVAITGLALGGDAASNYELDSEGQQSSTSANITPADMTVTATGYEGVYDRKPHSPAVDAPDGAEILWSDAENGTYAAGTPSFTDAGTYTAYYRVQRPNYKTVSGSVAVTIARKSVEGATVLLEQNDFIYDGETHIAVVRMVTLPDGDILSETDYSVSDNQTANAGYYLLTVTGQGNYKDTAKVSWTIRNAGASGISAANISITYDGKPRSISVVGAPDGAVITYSTDGETYSETNPEYTDAGTSQTVHYRVTASNYDEFNGSATITIAKRPVTVSGIAAANKAYDGNANATLDYSGVTFHGIVDGDELSVSATGTFADAEVGDGKTVNITNLTLGGKSVGNYQLLANGQQTETTANITANAMTVTASGYSGVYDGQPHSITVNAPDGATVTYSETESGTYVAENPTYQNAGTYTVFYKVTMTGSADVGGFETVIVSKKDIVISGITAANKPYDGNTDATLDYSGATFGGIVDGDELSVSATGTFADAEVGNVKTVNITNLTLGGADVSNYQLAAEGQQTETTANITTNALNVTASGYSGVYDGAAHGITVNAPDGASVSYSEAESGTYVAENPTYRNAGIYTVFYKVTLVGSDDVNGSQTVNITRREIVVSGIVAANKPYDGNTNATLDYSGVTFSGIVDGDGLSVSATGTFADAEVGSAKTVNITNLTLGGADAANYQLAAEGQQTETTANITTNAMTVTASGYSGVYDGAAHGITVNAPDGATVTYSEVENGAYSSTAPVYTNAGSYTVFYKVTLVGSDNVNGSQTVNINRKEIVVSGIAAVNKPYDGNTDATLIYSGVTFGGIVDGDELTVTATGTFADAEVGNGKSVNITNLTLGGADVSNYQLAAEGQQTETTANITANALNVTASGYSGVYDGAAHGITVNAPYSATVTYSQNENGAYSATAPAYTNAGTYTVFYKVTLAGSDDVNGSQTVNITRREIVVSGIAAANKPYDGNTNATLIYSGVTFGSIVDGDELTISATGTFADAEVGNAKTVNITNLTLGGADVANYQLAAGGQQTETTANITANSLNVTANGYSGVYDGEFHGITVNAPSGATVTYRETESGTYGAENPTYKNTGTYTVYYKVSMTGYADVTGSAVVSISKATLTLSLTMVDRSNPNQLRNGWPYADVPGVPVMSARRGVTEVSDYGLTVYSYKSASGAEYLPYSAEALEVLPVGAYVLRVEVGENRNYLYADAETGFTVRKAAHDDVSVGPLNVVVNGESELSVSLESYLEEGFQCVVSGAEGNLFSGEPAMDGGVLRFHTANSGGSGVVRVTVSSLNYEDYAIAVTLRAASALTLRFDANGGDEVTTVKSLRPGEPYGTLPASSRPGYDFDGWFTALTNGERVSEETVMGGVDTTLYAHWTKTDYTVTLRLNGGSLPSDVSGWNSDGNDATRIFHIDSEDFTLPEATRADYTFAGWTAPGQDIAQAAMEVTVFQGTMRNLTYEANWTEGERIGVVEFERPDEGSGILGVLNLTQEPGEIDAQKSDTDTDEYPATSLATALKEIACADETEVGENQTKDVTVSMNLRALSDLTDTDDETLDETSRQSKREQEKIKEAARRTFGESDDTVKSDFLSIDLEKIVTVKDDGGGESRESGALRALPKVLEIPLRYNMTGRYNPMIFRFHDNLASAFRRLVSRPRNYQSLDGCFYVSGAGNDAVIYIYASRFSSYSVTTSGTESWTVFFETDGGTEIPRQSVPTMGDGKVTRPDNPTKAGYAFAGWYVLDNGEEKPFQFDADAISADTVIYAKWTENAPVTPVTPSSSGGGGGSGPRSYRVAVADAEHGSVTVSAKTATSGQRVTITVTPESGYLTDSVTIKTAADKNVTVTKSGTNVFRFTMPANDVTVSAAFVKQDTDSGDTETETPPDNGDSEETSGPLSPEETGVADWLITDTHPAYISGFSDGTFRPESNITRAQAAMMFYRLLKNKAATKTVTFKDMNGSEWYAEAVYALAGFDIIRGYSDGSFHANESISRAAFTAIAIRLAKETVPDNAERFSDVPSGHWARDTIARASDYGWIGGYSDGTFHPSAPITRAAVTAIINRMLNRNADEEYVAEHYAELNHFSDVTDSNAWYFYNVMEAANAHDFNASEGKEHWTR